MLFYNRFTRRGLIGCALVVAGLCQACAPTNSQDLGLAISQKRPQTQLPQIPDRPKRRFSPDDPARILVIGDSLADGIGTLLDQRIAALALNATSINRGRNSTGLARRDFYDWPQNFATMAASTNPDLIVVHFGANDWQGLISPDYRIPLGAETWEATYRAEIRKVLKVAADLGTPLFWLGPGPDRNPGLNRHLTYINSLFVAEAKASNATYIPISAFAADAQGNFTRNVELDGRNVTIRAGDGSHYTPRGYGLIADQILVHINRQAPSIASGADVLFAALQ